MDDFSKVIAGIATRELPSLAGIFFGPAAGAVTGALATAIAPALGIDASDKDAATAAVATAAKEDPGKVASVVKEALTGEKAAAVLGEMSAAAFEAQAKIVSEINQTARLELQSDDRFTRWARPANLWANAAVGLIGGIGVFVGIVSACFGRPEPLTHIVNATPALLALCGALAVVAGISANGRTKEKLAGIPGAASPITTIINSVRGPK